MLLSSGDIIVSGQGGGQLFWQQPDGILRQVSFFLKYIMPLFVVNLTFTFLIKAFLASIFCKYKHRVFHTVPILSERINY
jgi:hypothetical protein